MAIPITIPRFGWTMEEGVFLGWLKEDGAAIHPGDALFRLESEKATEDVECLETGVLHIAPDCPKPGERVLVGTIIGHIASAGETVFQAKEIPPPPPQNAPSAELPVGANVQVAEITQETTTPRLAITPRARRIARELGVDWAGLHGSGRKGRIRECDVRAAAASARSRPSSHSAGRTIPLTSMRRTIAERMLESHRSTAPVTLHATGDATNLVNLRNQFKASMQAGYDLVPSYTDVLIKLTALALEKHPLLNAAWTDDGLLVHDSIDVGVAVDTEEGLVVPVVRDVPTLSLKQLSQRTRDLLERAQQRRLRAEELQPGTFTLTNLGAWGIDTFTPIINPPQCAILGVGRIERRPVVVGDHVVAREQIALSLTFDHRLVDGAPAARFLQTLLALLQNPAPWLTS